MANRVLVERVEKSVPSLTRMRRSVEVEVVVGTVWDGGGEEGVVEEGVDEE